MGEIIYRRGTETDSYGVFCLFEETFADLLHRFGLADETEPAWHEPEKLARMWAERQSLYDYLGQSAEHFWLAEQDGQIVGFARSVFHGGVRELTEFFVRPSGQSAGVGQELLRRAFPAAGASHRLIIATMDVRAQVRYLKTGVYPHFPLYYFWREPQTVTVTTDLQTRPLTLSPETIDILAALDQTVIGFRRDGIHSWLSENRQGWLYYRAGQPVGYGYTGKNNGPFALLDSQDFPAVLAQAESFAAAHHPTHFGLELPMINQVAVTYLLERGFRMDNFAALFMWDKPLGDLSRYICTSPPFFM
ncbi:MAG: GNAT family N-acetyltransferase [Anaerolineae bacterium]|nr:GNAT family N-acetyltransferase [Anaerolineae bacterium]